LSEYAKEKYENYTSKSEDDESREKLSWMDMAKEKWDEWTKKSNESRKDDPNEYSFYNNTYFDKFKESLPEEKWTKYLEFRDFKPEEKDDRSFWNKTMTLFSEGKEKLADLTNYDENKEKVVDWAKGLISGNKTEASNSTSGDNDHKEERRNKTEEALDEKDKNATLGYFENEEKVKE